MRTEASHKTEQQWDLMSQHSENQIEEEGVNSLKVMGTESREYRARKLLEEGKLFLAGRHRGRPRGGNRNFIQTLKCRPKSLGRRRDAEQKDVRGDRTRCGNRHGLLGASINQFD